MSEEYTMYGANSNLYTAWVESYDPNNFELSTIEKFVPINGKRVLDIGCGTGRFFLKVLPFAECVVGVDPDAKAVQELQQRLNSLPGQVQSKTALISAGIEDCSSKDIGPIDVAVFSWSFYTLNQEQVLKTARLLRDVLREDGCIVILQPVGGVFEEEIMRKFFKSNEDMEEYKNAICNINNILPWFFDRITLERITSEFCTSDLEFLTKALQMFARTEGGKEDTSDITEEAVLKESSKYRDDTGVFRFSDEVDMYVLKNRK